MSLVSLAACESGLVDFREVADEHYGLPLGFLYAGAPAVYSSLWTVDDCATGLLMARTHELLREGKGKAAALRGAQNWLRQATKRELIVRLEQRDGPEIPPAMHYCDDHEYPYAHPLWWGAFQCVGT